jgi:hypothetical protein
MRALAETVSSPDGRVRFNRAGAWRRREGAGQDPAPIAATAVSPPQDPRAWMGIPVGDCSRSQVRCSHG